MIMIVTMLSRIDSGVRYVMLGYVFMSMLAALAVVTLWQRREHSSRRTRCCYRSAALDGGFICDVAS